MILALKILIFFGTVLAMEGGAWLAHKYLMHGPMWFLHKDHHVKRPDQVMEKNDWFAFLFALPAIALIWIGVHVWSWALPVGIGITAYGLIYFIFHDMIVHQRIKTSLPDWPYLNRIIEAHRIHHHVRTKEGCVSFGFVITPKPAWLKAKLKAIKAAQNPQ